MIHMMHAVLNICRVKLLYLPVMCYNANPVIVLLLINGLFWC